MKQTVRLLGEASEFCGTLDENLKLFESALQVTANLRDEKIELVGESARVQEAARLIKEYNNLVRNGKAPGSDGIQSLIRMAADEPEAPLRGTFSPVRGPRAIGRKQITPKGLNQRRYMEALESFDMVFAVGPGGTGKTYLAVAMAVQALLSKQVNRIILARPAVEAGERLGFLPGTLQEKVDPYMRPLYDALYDLLDADKLERFLEKGIIEVAPLAFMRGRTLNDSFVILDEAQNTTSEQMKMFLTRLGFNSKAVITGDITQIDLPNDRRSGLIEAIEIVGKIDGIAFVYFDERDVVRHSLVQRIIKAYDEHGASPALYARPRQRRGCARNSAAHPATLKIRPWYSIARDVYVFPIAPPERFLGSVLRHLRFAGGKRYGLHRRRCRCSAMESRVSRQARPDRCALVSGEQQWRRRKDIDSDLGKRGARARAARAEAVDYLGDIAISPVVARRNAERFGRSLSLELRILILHGCCICSATITKPIAAKWSATNSSCARASELA